MDEDKPVPSAFKVIKVDFSKIKRLRPEPEFGPTYLPNPASCYRPGCHRPCPMAPKCTAYRHDYKGYRIRK